MQYEVLNATIFEQATPEKIVSVCNDVSTIPAIFIYFIASNLVLLIIGSVIVDNKKLFYKIFFMTLAITFALALGIIYLPHFIQTLYHSGFDLLK